MCAYRTISFVAANLIAAMSPIDLLTRKLRVNGHGKTRSSHSLTADGVTACLAAIRGRTFMRWSRQLESADTGEWTRSLRNGVHEWCSRRRGEVSFRLTEVLSGHGCFSKYLARIKKEATSQRHHCDAAVDDAEHTSFVCPCASQERDEAVRVLGVFEPVIMVRIMVE